MNSNEIFQENVINSFKKARKDIAELQNSLFLLKQEISEIKTHLTEKSSIGNEGVLSKRASEQAIKQAHSKQPSKHLSTLGELNEDLDAHFSTYTRQELKIFLSLYQLEDEVGPIRFTDLSDYMKLSEGCVRAYIYKLIARGSPILKEKVNNQVVNLSLSPEFRSLNLKKRLQDIYYQADPSQKRLFDDY
jgi:hypothetical protein